MKGATNLVVMPWGSQGSVGQVHPVLDTHSNQIALATGMRPVVMQKRGHRFLRGLGASALDGEFGSRSAHALKIGVAVGYVRYSTIGIGVRILTAGFLRR